MRENIYLQMFFIFFKIGMTTFGGGHAMLPVIKREIVDRYEWVSNEEFIDAAAVAQSLPGAVAANISTFIGYRVKGYIGALIAILGVILPSFLVILAIANLFVQFIENKIVAAAFAGVRPVIVSLIAAAVLKVGKPVLRKKSGLLLTILYFILATALHINPIILILAGAVNGVLTHWRSKRKENAGKTSNDSDNITLPS